MKSIIESLNTLADKIDTSGASDVKPDYKNPNYSIANALTRIADNYNAESGGGSGGGGIEYVGKYEGTNAEGGTVQTYGSTVTFELTGGGSTEGGGTFVMVLAGFSGPMNGGELVISSVGGYYDVDEGKFYAGVGVNNTTESAVQYNDGAFNVTYEVFKISADDGSSR